MYCTCCKVQVGTVHDLEQRGESQAESFSKVCVMDVSNDLIQTEE